MDRGSINKKDRTVKLPATQDDFYLTNSLDTKQQLTTIAPWSDLDEEGQWPNGQSMFERLMGLHLRTTSPIDLVFVSPAYIAASEDDIMCVYTGPHWVEWLKCYHKLRVLTCWCNQHGYARVWVWTHRPHPCPTPFTPLCESYDHLVEHARALSIQV